jgi:hypothetical protein
MRAESMEYCQLHGTYCGTKEYSSTSREKVNRTPMKP